MLRLVFPSYSYKISVTKLNFHYTYICCSDQRDKDRIYVQKYIQYIFCYWVLSCPQLPISTNLNPVLQSL
jgi:hypothetical protein